MHDGDALLAAIIAHPDEDTPRLVYADWLEENDQPERAEFIRLQISTAKLPNRMKSGAVMPPRMHPRESALLKEHRNEWIGPLAQILPKAQFDFWRGFVEAVLTSPELYLRHASELFATTPVRDIRLLAESPEIGGEFTRVSLTPRPPRTRLRINMPVRNHLRQYWADLLQNRPKTLEPILLSGWWVVVAWASWAPLAAGRVADFHLLVNHQCRWLSRAPSVAFRPFDDHSEFSEWCPLEDVFGTPHVLLLKDGRLVTHHNGPLEHLDASFWSAMKS
jgi:uncharacterized protein (TIGR02996 family)